MIFTRDGHTYKVTRGGVLLRWYDDWMLCARLRAHGCWVAISYAASDAA